MQRRQLIRILGGGSIAAAALPLAGCATALPEVATEAWRGASTESDVRRWALAHAILAPNPHNLQSWAVDLSQPDTITLWVDRLRLLPETDPNGRQVLIGMGAFLELLVQALAQRGRDADVALFPAGEPATLAQLPAQPVARITLRAGGQPDPLFAQVLRRRTAKGAFDSTRPVTATTLLALAPSVQPSTVQWGSELDAQRVRQIGELCLQALRIEFATPRTVMESIRLVRVGPEEIAKHRDGISVNSPMARFAATFGFFDRNNPPAPGSTAQKQTDAQDVESCGTAMGFVWLSTGTNTRSQQIATGRAFVRVQLRATELNLAMHPLSQPLQEYAEMQPLYESVHRLLLGRAAPRSNADTTLQMLCRVGYSVAPQPASPRRELASIMRSA